MDVIDFEGWILFYDLVFYGYICCVVIFFILGVDVEVEMKDFIKLIEMVEDEEMILVVGRFMVLNKIG